MWYECMYGFHSCATWQHNWVNMISNLNLDFLIPLYFYHKQIREYRIARLQPHLQKPSSHLSSPSSSSPLLPLLPLLSPPSSSSSFSDSFTSAMFFRFSFRFFCLSEYLCSEEPASSLPLLTSAGLWSCCSNEGTVITMERCWRYDQGTRP